LRDHRSARPGDRDQTISRAISDAVGDDQRHVRAWDQHQDDDGRNESEKKGMIDQERLPVWRFDRPGIFPRRRSPGKDLAFRLGLSSTLDRGFPFFDEMI
jgi:hypothetical protein